MDPAVYVIAAILLLGALYFVVPFALTALFKYRGKRVITCPETRQPAAVEVDARHAAATAAIGRLDLRLKDCSRWPEKKDCDQACLLQVELSPEECLLRNIIARWYAGKSCVLCGRPFGHINWIDHKPAIMDEEGKTLEWGEIAAERVPAAMDTHTPVCWDCHVAETLRRIAPEVVTDRDWKATGVGRR
ncbi:MAG TPA: hypothetical protein VJQ56_13655 [Blastocatellia bacterium]|nr:hypothetical protein [Blastocatellia bacterium]